LGAFKSPQDIVLAARSENPDQMISDNRFFAIPEHGPAFDSPQRLYAPQEFLTDAYLSQSHRADWQHADPRIRYWAALFIEYARKRGIPLYVHSAFRTEAEQSALVAAGRSRAPFPRSAHNTGQAVDIVHSVFYWEMSKRPIRN